MVYQSYINDTLDFSGINGGYYLYNMNQSYCRMNPCKLTVSNGQYVTLGNTSVEIGVSGSQISDGKDIDSAGIFFNREFAAEIDEYNGGAINPRFDNNHALQREITQSELNTIINIHNKLNYYSLSFNNCSIVASKAWNYSLTPESWDKYNLCEWDAFGILYKNYVDTPLELHTKINMKVGSYYFDMWKALGLY